MKIVIKPIPSHDGYFIDNEGHIYSQWINKGQHGLVKGEDLVRIKGSKTKHGHLHFRFGRNGNVRLIHRLVYEVFKGEIPEGKVIRHINDIPDDNRIDNLEIGTQKDNVHDCIRNGNFQPINPNRKFTDEQISKIKALAETKTVKELAVKFNVSERTIRNLINNYYKKEIS